MNFDEWLRSTMLIERFVGVLSYFIIIVITYNGLKKGSTKKALGFCLVLLTILAFFYVPGKYADLTRIREMTAKWGTAPFDVFFKETVLKSSIPVAYLSYYLVSLIGIPGLLPAACVLVFYSNAFHIFLSLERTRKYTSHSIALSFLLFMCSGVFLFVVSNVRCFVAFSVIMRLAFDEIFYKKPLLLHIPFFVLVSLVHPAAIVLSFMWLIYYAIFAKQSFVQRAINISLIIAVIIVAFYFGGNYINSALNRGNTFLQGDTYTYIWEYIIGWVELLAFIYLLISHFKNRKIASRETNDFFLFSCFFTMFLIVFSFEYSIFHRYITALSFFIIPISVVQIDLSNKKQFSGALRTNPTLVVFFLSSIVLMLACARGDMSGFKFFLLG